MVWAKKIPNIRDRKRPVKKTVKKEVKVLEKQVKHLNIWNLTSRCEDMYELPTTTIAQYQVIYCNPGLATGLIATTDSTYRCVYDTLSFKIQFSGPGGGFTTPIASSGHARCVLIQDLGNLKALPTVVGANNTLAIFDSNTVAGGLSGNAIWMAKRNVTMFDRFKCLGDKTIRFDTINNYKSLHFYKKFNKNKVIQYLNNNGTVADCQSGQIFLVIFADPATVAEGVQFNGVSNINFERP